MNCLVHYMVPRERLCECSKLQIVGAAWGARLTANGTRKNWREAWRKMLDDPLCYVERDKGYGADQKLIAK